MKKFFFVMILLLFVKASFAQERDTSYKYWMTLGFWVDRDITANFNYNFSLDKNFFKVNYLTKGGSFFSRGNSPGGNGIIFNSIDVSIGKRLQSKWIQASFFVGPSYVYGEKRINISTNEKYHTAGLQIDALLLFRIANEIGFGIGLFTNFNFEENFTGFDINLTLGNGK